MSLDIGIFTVTRSLMRSLKNYLEIVAKVLTK